jgi:hypothetical protein
MAFEFLAAIVAAVAVGGMVHLLRRLTGWRMPRWSVPASAGLAMIVFTVWSEYDWFSRVSAELPPGVTVVWSAAEANPMRPWTFLAPITTQFIAIDGREISVHPVNADLRIARFYNFSRWRPVEDRMMVFDCATGLQATLTDTVKVTAEGTLSGEDWIKVSPDDGFQRAACQED